MDDDFTEELDGIEDNKTQENTESSFYDNILNLKENIDNINAIKNKIESRKLNNISEMTKNTSSNFGTKSLSNGMSEAAASEATASGAATSGAAASGAAASGAAASGAAASGAAASGAAASGAAASGAAASGAAASGAAGLLTVVGWIVLIIIAVTLVGAVIASFYYSVINPLSIKYSVDETDLVNKYDNNTPDDEVDENDETKSDSELGGINNITKTDDLDLDELLGNVSTSRTSISDTIRLKIYELFSWLPGNKFNENLVNKIVEIMVNNKLKEMGTDNKEELPLGALLTTFTYAYSSQYLKSGNKIYTDIIKNENGINEEILVDRVNVTTPISMLTSLFNEEILTLGDLSDTNNPNDIKDLIDNMVFHEFYPTYSWEEVDKECDYDDDGNTTSCTIYMGCSKSDNESYKLDYYKYYLYLRYGAYVSGYAVGSSNVYEKLENGNNTKELWGKSGIKNYKEDSNDTIAFGYEYFKNLNAAYISSSNECKLKQVANASFEKLNASADENIKYEMIEGNAEHSVDRANNFFKVRDVTNGVDTININHEIFSNFSKYDEKANSNSSDNLIPQIKVDNTIPNGNGSFAVNYNSGENYEYKHGWIYNRFPFYRKGFQLEENKEYEYDNIVTPRDIEKIIENIDTHKDIFNSVLGYETTQNSNDWSQSFNSDGTESFPLPAGKYKITSCVGERTIDGELSNHGGIDIAVSRNTPLYSWKKGAVVSTNNSCGEGFYGNSCGGGYGNYVIIEHISENGEKQYTMYAHMSSVNVSSGDQVSAGQQIGLSGNSGSSTGPHLHFEIRTGGTEWSNATKQDPYPTLAEIANDPDLSSTCSENTYINVGTTTLTPSTGADSNLANMVLTEAYKYVGNTDKEFNKATGVKVSSAWCARFVSYILNKVGVIPSIMKGISSDEDYTESYYDYFLSNSDGVVWNYSNSNYTPKPGDIIMFNYKEDEGRNVSHIGFVKSVSGNKITYIHGNTSKTCNPGISSVCESVILKSDSVLIGFASWY